MTPDWRIVEFQGHEGLRRLEADWKRLVAEMPDRAPHHAYEAHRAYFNHLSRAMGQYSCLALSDGEQVRAICPLESETVEILGRRTRAWGLPWHLYDLGRDVVCPQDEARREVLPCLVRFLRSRPGRPSWLVFGGVLEGSAALECLRSLDSGTYCTDVAGAADVIDCRRPFEELSAGFSRQFRSNLRKAHRKLDALAEVRFVHADDPVSVGRELEAFLEVEASGWKGEAGVRGAIRLKPELLAFYRELAGSLRDLARFEINALYAEGRCIASQLCVRAGAEYVIPKVCYDEHYARAKPGLLLLERTLQRCCQDPGIRRLNLLSHREWHQDFGPHAVPLHFAYVALGRWSGPPLVRLLRLRIANGPRVKRWLQGLHFGTAIMGVRRGAAMDGP